MKALEQAEPICTHNTLKHPNEVAVPEREKGLYLSCQTCAPQDNRYRGFCYDAVTP